MRAGSSAVHRTSIPNGRCCPRRCASYAALWREDRAVLERAGGECVATYRRGLGVAFAASVEALPDAARVLLERLAFFAPDPVPGTLFDIAVPDGAAVGDTRAALAELAARSLALPTPDRRAFTIHHLVQHAVCRRLDPAAARQRLTEALNWIDAAFSCDRR